MALIKLNYDLAIIQAKELAKAASECRELATSLKEQIEKVQFCWSGEASNAYIEKVLLWKKQIESEADMLETLSQKVRSKAETLRSIDEDAHFLSGGTGYAGGGGSGKGF